MSDVNTIVGCIPKTMMGTRFIPFMTAFGIPCQPNDFLGVVFEFVGHGIPNLHELEP